MIKNPSRVLDLGLLPAGWMEPGALPLLSYERIVQTCIATRQAPMTPCAFYLLVESKFFMNGADRAKVGRKYERTYLEVMGNARQLDMRSLKWMDSDILELTEALPSFPRLEVLRLDCNDITDEGAAALALTVRSCPRL